MHSTSRGRAERCGKRILFLRARYRLAVPRTASHRGRCTDTARLSGAPYRYPVARKQFAVVPSVATGGVVAPRSASQSACGGACGISVAESAVEAVSERDGNRRVLSLAFSRASFSFTFLQLPSVLTCMSFPRFNSRNFFFLFSGLGQVEAGCTHFSHLQETVKETWRE